MTAEEKDIKKMKVVELRAALEKRGLSTDGLKVDLIHRLQARLDEEEFGLADVNLATANAAATTSTATIAADEGGKTAEAPPKRFSMKDATAASETPKENSAVFVISREKDDTEMEIDASTTEKEQQAETSTSMETTIPEDDFEAKKKKRAQRFGLKVPETKDELEMKKKKRAQRFGLMPEKGGDEFEEMKKKRAMRFGIAVVGSDAKKDERQRAKRLGVDSSDGGSSSLQKAKRLRRGGGSDDDDELSQLSKDELERRLARAVKYQLGNDAIDPIKAMLRKHRFQPSN